MPCSFLQALHLALCFCVIWCLHSIYLCITIAFFHSIWCMYIVFSLLQLTRTHVLIQGKVKQQKRTSTFFEFCNASSGILLCTDVAARGLDIPAVDWIVQFDPPDDPKEYIHRVGRTARGESGQGRALLFLLPEELGYLRFLRAAKIPLNEYEFPPSKIANVQGQLEGLIGAFVCCYHRCCFEFVVIIVVVFSLRVWLCTYRLSLQRRIIICTKPLVRPIAPVS